MNFPDVIPIDEAQINLLFEQAGMTDAPAPDQRRIDSVLERAVHESLIKETSSFVLRGFPLVVSAMLDVASCKVSAANVDYKA